MFSTNLERSIIHLPWPSKLVHQEVHQGPYPHLGQGAQQQVAPVQRDSITTGTPYMRLMLFHTHKLWPCPSSKWFTEIGQLYGQNHCGLILGSHPLVQVYCLRHHILCDQGYDQLPDLTPVLGLGSGLQHHHAGAHPHQILAHIINRELVPQSKKMRNHVIKNKANHIRLFTFHGYKEFDEIKNITFNNIAIHDHYSPLLAVVANDHKLSEQVQHLNLDPGAVQETVKQPLRFQSSTKVSPVRYKTVDIGQNVFSPYLGEMLLKKMAATDAAKLELLPDNHQQPAHPHHGLPLDKPGSRQVHRLHHHQENSASTITSYPGQPKTNQKGYKNSTNMGTSLMRVQDNNGPQHQVLVPLPMQHLQLPVHELSAEIKLAHNHHLLLQCDLRPVDPSVVLLFNIQAIKQLCPHHAGIVDHHHRREVYDPEGGHRLHEAPGTPPLQASFHLKLYLVKFISLRMRSPSPPCSCASCLGRISLSPTSSPSPLLSGLPSILQNWPHSPAISWDCLFAKYSCSSCDSVNRYHGCRLHLFGKSREISEHFDKH